ncbi:N-acetylneuraminate synthase family protein [Ferrovibrio sp.]|uniref:N-acetylneuraminate synthase family protein n=1 Tax=Ferrovibrio sp. TaxID=1917215 RepID=UPI002610B0DD|nr:N-acetylneuraminate synthase family protein [Ferrovibrio sp.]
MIDPVRIGDRLVGPGHPCFVTAEIGINHNGDMEIAKRLVDASVESGCDAVKFQKRTVDVVYTAEELARERENPFGRTNGDLKYGLEFGLDAYKEVDSYCRSKNILWFVSAWDEASVDFTEAFNPPCYKIASASLTDDGLLKRHRDTGRPIILSTGMSSLAQIDHAVEILGTKGLIILHATSTYPSKPEELNLRCIPMLTERYGVPVGYSGHEVGLSTSAAAVALGACMVERHITLDRAMWGSDQAASVEPQGFHRLVRDIRTIETALGNGEKVVYPSEVPIREKLRRIDTRRLVG